MSHNDIRKLYDTAISAGIQMISTDKCCRLLAWLLIYGGGCAQVTTNWKLHNDIMYAQKRFNIYGGEIPGSEFIPIFQDYVNLVTNRENPPEWVILLEKEYKFKIKR